MDNIIHCIEDVLNDLAGEGKIVSVEDQTKQTVFDVAESFVNVVEELKVHYHFMVLSLLTHGTAT